MNKLNHIAFIMDGNGRWGKKKNKGRNFGHLKGVETVKLIVKESLKVKNTHSYILCFFFRELEKTKIRNFILFKLIKNYFLREINNVITQGIKINIIGELKKIPNDLKTILNMTVKKTNKNKKIIVNLAINYGSKKEILIATKKANRKLNLKNINRNLFTKTFPT